MTNCRAAQLEVLDVVSDAFETIAIEADDVLKDDVIAEANRRLKEDGHPFEFYSSGYRVYVKELK